MSDADPAVAQLNALVGAALRGLVSAGASAEAIGAFAASYREEAAQLLGLKPKQPEAPDLRELVMDAVKDALASQRGRRREKPAGQRAQRFTVMVNGQRTTVTIRQEVASRLIEEKQGIQEARALVQSLASTAPVSVKNRSRWVEDRVLATLSMANGPASAEHPTRH